MEIFGYTIDLTFGPIFTAVLVPALGWYVARLIHKQDQLHDERHQSVVDAIHENRTIMMAKLDAHCEHQNKLHSSIDKRFWNHQHTEDGDIVIKGGM